MATPIRVAAAVSWLLAADLALALHAVTTKLGGGSGETRLYRCLNSAVARADANPHLPAMFRDPRDVADSTASSN
ncbi:hypothetical protein [Streptomyces sp. NPDC001530]|uniref:hypothetical protein n=1 Tax=Streptomyces sp. NPDC001530 TaxID=3364582 RepID=UPI0036A58105